MSSYGDFFVSKSVSCSSLTCQDLQAPGTVNVKIEAAQPATTTVGKPGQLFFCTAATAAGGGIWICTAVTVAGETTTYTWLRLSSAVDAAGGA